MRVSGGPLLLEDMGVDPNDGVHYFVTKRELVFLHGEIELRVPVGTKTDLTTIPWYLQWLIPKMGPHNMAVVFHDWLCRNRLYSRFLGDALFREAMSGRCGKFWPRIPLWRRVMMYYGVRIYAVIAGKK